MKNTIQFITLQYERGTEEEWKKRREGKEGKREGVLERSKDIKVNNMIKRGLERENGIKGIVMEGGRERWKVQCQIQVKFIM